MSAYILTTAPGTEPVDLDDLKAHCHVDTDDDDDYITELGILARQKVEEDTGRCLLEQTWTLYLDEFPSSDLPIMLQRATITAVNSITYTDTDGVSQTITDAQTDLYSIPARVMPAYEDDWPSTREIPNAVAIEFDAGYALAADIPMALIHAIKLLVGTWYEHRETLIVGVNASQIPAPVAYDRVIYPYRLWAF